MRIVTAELMYDDDGERSGYPNVVKTPSGVRSALSFEVEKGGERGNGMFFGHPFQREMG